MRVAHQQQDCRTHRPPALRLANCGARRLLCLSDQQPAAPPTSCPQWTKSERVA